MPSAYAVLSRALKARTPFLTPIGLALGRAQLDSGLAAAALESFRSTVVEATGAASEFLVLNYCRAVLGQTGGGHFSPVAAYHAASDSALVLDVARFKYPPYFVPLPLLYDSMSAEDPSTGRARGYLRVAAAEGAAQPASP